MADFINTIDVLGDDAVMDGIISRTITEFKDDKIAKIGPGAFAGCKSLASVDLPNATTTEGLIFTDCTALATVNLPSLTKIGEQAFRGCKALKTISLPALTVTTGYLGFEGCSALESVIFPVEEEVGIYSFQGCSSLKIIDLPALSKIKTGGLQCQNLIALLLRKNSVCTLENTNAFQGAIVNGTGYIYVPSALIDSYKAAANWSNFADQFRSLEEWTVDGTVTGELSDRIYSVCGDFLCGEAVCG